MSRRERDTHVRLEEMSEEQIGIVREEVIVQLIGAAGDLRLLNRLRDPKRAIREVAALARLAFWLGHREIVVPDPPAREVMARIVEGLDEIDRDLLERYEEAVAEHDATRALFAYLSNAKGDESR